LWWCQAVQHSDLSLKKKKKACMSAFITSQSKHIKWMLWRWSERGLTWIPMLPRLANPHNP
jgi:hypothetical protein